MIQPFVEDNSRGGIGPNREPETSVWNITFLPKMESSNPYNIYL